MSTSALLETLPQAFIAVDGDGRVIAWNPSAAQTFGWEADEALGRPLVELIVPERLRETYSTDLERYLTTRRSRLLGRRLEFEALHRDGHEFPVEARIGVIESDEGPVFHAVAQDVSERKRAAADLAESQERFARAFEAAPIGMALVAPSGGFLAVNRTLCELTGRSAEELLASDFQAITHPQDLDRDLEHIERLLRGERDSYEMEKRYLRPDGEVVWGLLRVVLVRDPDGEPAYFVSQILEITDRKQTEQNVIQSAKRLQQLAVRDPLTGLRNLPDLRSALEVEVERARRYGRDLALAVFDVEGFGQLNRTRGREYGDRVLRAVAQLLEAASREPDLAARIGDDAFALILPETDRAGAETAAGRIADHLRALEHLDATLAFGVAAHTGPRMDANDLLSAAERDLRERAGLYEPSGNEPPLGRHAADTVRHVLRLAREQLGVDVAFLSRVVDDTQTFLAVEGDAASFQLEPGARAAFDESYCARMVRGEIPNVIGDLRNHPDLADLEVTVEADVGAYIGAPVVLRDGELYGTLCGLSHSRRQDLSDADVDLITFLADVLGGVLSRERDARDDRDAAVEFSGIHALLAALEARDQYTSDHSHTVVSLARAVAERLGLDQRQMVEVEQVALLHDIGKVGIPDSILLKRGPLSETEWELMRQHPAVGERIVANTHSLAHLAPAVRAEHERYDGRGYPDGLRGSQIPIASRITLACDAYDAMTTDRPYRAARSEEDARKELADNAGTQFDPDVVEALLEILDARARNATLA